MLPTSNCIRYAKSAPASGGSRTDAPLLIVEIFSPQQGYQDVMQKVDVYFRNGVKNCWVVSPPLHTVSILRPDGATDTFNSGLAKDPATGLTADLEAVFS